MGKPRITIVFQNSLHSPSVLSAFVIIVPVPTVVLYSITTGGLIKGWAAAAAAAVSSPFCSTRSLELDLDRGGRLDDILSNVYSVNMEPKHRQLINKHGFCVDTGRTFRNRNFERGGGGHSVTRLKTQREEQLNRNEDSGAEAVCGTSLVRL